MPAGDSNKRILILLFWFCYLAAPVGETLAEPTSDAVRAAEDLRASASSGLQLELSRKWLEAIEHYEQALKRWPDTKQLEIGLRRSKIHFGIDRRYTDASFERRLVTRSRDEALALFDEVLLQVRSSYVEQVSSKSFLAHGTESFYLALANRNFLDRNLRGADPGRIKHLRSELQQVYWNKPLANRREARDALVEVCELARSLLGLSSGPVVMEYVFGGCHALDDYSSFLTPDRLDDLYGNIEGEFVGLGIEMKAELGKGLLLVDVLPESPASEGGMVPGDHIVSVNGTDCRQMTTDEAARLLRGPTDSSVQIELQSPLAKVTRRHTFRRRAVQVKSIPVARMIDARHGIGYIRMTGFQKTSALEMDQALNKLNGQGMRSLIWDLRGNPGGLLTAAVEVVDRYIDDGVLVSTRGRTRDQNWSYSAHRPGTWNIPLVLLVDGNSASASEIVAGALNDYSRGVIVGRTTYGKWSVQTIFPVRGSTGLRLTTAKFYSPLGRTLGKIGVKPDVVVEASNRRRTYYRPSDLDARHDADIRKGLEILRTQISQR